MVYFPKEIRFPCADRWVAYHFIYCHALDLQNKNLFQLPVISGWFLIET